MAAQKGRELLVYISDGTSPGNFTLVSGLRDTTLTITDQEIDVTTKDDNGIRKLLSGRVMRSMSVSGTGVFLDNTWAETMRQLMFDGTHREYRIVVPGAGDAGGTYEGEFRIISIEYTGAHDGAVNYSISLQSAGDIAFTMTP